MKNLEEKIQWYTSQEVRKWKRIYHSIEITVIALLGLFAAGVVLIYGSGERFESVVLLFTLCLAIASSILAPAMYKPYFKRWQIFGITLGLGSGMGLAVVACFLVLELQRVVA